MIESDPGNDDSHGLIIGDLDDQIGFRLRFALAAVWNDLNAAFKPYDLRPQHFAALRLIATNPGCKQQDIGDALAISKSNIVAFLDGLIRKNLLVRYPNPDDRRSYALHLTQKGNFLLASLDDAQKEHEQRLNQIISDEEAQYLNTILRKLANLGSVGK